MEDPVEYRMGGIKQVQVSPKAGQTFACGLRSTLRADPCVVRMGEIRDHQTARISDEAALTGRLVFGTLRTQDAPQTIDRVIDVFPPHQIRAQLASALRGVITQTLIPRQDAIGWVVACEILVPTPGIRNLIREGKFHQIYSTMQTGGNFGMRTMDASLVWLVRAGLISRAEAEKRSSNPEELRRLAGERSAVADGPAPVRR